MRFLMAFSWWLAVVGGVAAIVVVPALILLFAFALPGGGLGSPSESLQQLGSLLSLSRVVPGVLVIAHLLVFWHAAHQLRWLLLDLRWPGAQVFGVLAHIAALGGGVWAARALSIL